MDYAEEQIKSLLDNLLKNYRLELFFILLSFTGILVSAGLYLRAQHTSDDAVASDQVQFVQKSTEVTKEDTAPKTILIDLSGAVEDPDVYEVTAGARLNDVLVLANGLSQSADREFFARNFNLARVLADQEKIHIPSQREVQGGLFQEGTFVMTGIAAPASAKATAGRPAYGSNGLVAGTSMTGNININSASQAELESLVGIGPARARDIIAGRPYNSVAELSSKKIIPQSVFEKIKAQITTQ